MVSQVIYVIYEYFFEFLGRSYLITSQRTLLQCLESLVQKIQIGVVVNLEKVISEGMMKQIKIVAYYCRKLRWRIQKIRKLSSSEKKEVKII